MKKILQSLVVIVLAFTIISCSDNFQYSEEQWKKEFPKHSKCGVEYQRNDFMNDVGITLFAVSKDKSYYMCHLNSQQNSFIISKDDNFMPKSINFSNIDVSDSTVEGGFYNALFCPYDNNIVIGFVVISTIIGKDRYGENIYHFFKELCIYNIKTNVIKKVQLNLSKDEYEVISNNGLIHWVNQSTPNDDYILTKNHKRLHLQSGKLLEGYSNKTNDMNSMLVAVSPDESKFICLNPNNKNGEFYINDRKHTDKVLFQSFKINQSISINWSVDSRIFSTIQYGMDDIDYNFYTITDGNSIFKSNSFDVISMHCSLYADGTPLFYSDTSYIVSLYPNLTLSGELYEVNKKGEIIRQLTKFF